MHWLQKISTLGDTDEIAQEKQISGDNWGKFFNNNNHQIWVDERAVAVSVPTQALAFETPQENCSLGELGGSYCLPLAAEVSDFNSWTCGKRQEHPGSFLSRISPSSRFGFKQLASRGDKCLFLRPAKWLCWLKVCRDSKEVLPIDVTRELQHYRESTGVYDIGTIYSSVCVALVWRTVEPNASNLNSVFRWGGIGLFGEQAVVLADDLDYRRP